MILHIPLIMRGCFFTRICLEASCNKGAFILLRKIIVLHNFTACPIKCCMKLAESLPSLLSERIASIHGIRELRIRDNRAAKVNVNGQWYFVGEKALVQRSENALILGEVCDGIIKKACNNSVYAYEKMLAKGFFTLEDGVRIGVCGVVADGRDRVFQKYTSLCFRVPHYVSCVDSEVLQQCRQGNTLLIGPPASGKTTFLRDLAVKLSQSANVLVVDERGELFYDNELLKSSHCDVLKWSDKFYAFESGVRAMSPDFIVCDELSSEDAVPLKQSLASGVKVICSVHGSTLEDFTRKFDLVDYFRTAVILKGAGSPFTVKNLQK